MFSLCKEKWERDREREREREQNLQQYTPFCVLIMLWNPTNECRAIPTRYLKICLYGWPKIVYDYILVCSSINQPTAELP